MAVVTEGGYDLTALAACIDEAFAAVTGVPSAVALAIDGSPAPRGERALAAVRQAQHSFWPGL